MSNTPKIGKKHKTKFTGRQFSGLTQSFKDYEDLQAAVRVSRSKPDFSHYDLPTPSDIVARRITEAMARARSGYQPDGSYVDDKGVRMSKTYMDNLETSKEELEGKGLKGQRCNRTACQAPGAYWYNHSTQKHYCGTCADIINAANRQDSFTRSLGHELLTLEPEYEDKRMERA